MNASTRVPAGWYFKSVSSLCTADNCYCYPLRLCAIFNPGLVPIL